MSVLFLVIFIAMLKDPDVTVIGEEFCYAWALFSIADALWVRTIFGR